MAGLFAPWEAPPQFCPRPPDAALEQRVTKLAGYVRRNGADFQQHIREKQQGNPEYSFLFGGDGSEYYRWVLYCMVHNLPSEAPAPSGPPGGGAPEGQSMATAAVVAQLPPNIATGLVQTLSELTGSKDSIKSSRKWFLDNHQHSAALVAALMQHYRQLGDYQRMLHVIYMINDIVIHSAQMAPTQPEVPGIVNGAFQPVIPEVITMAFDKSGRQSEVRERLTRIVKLWAERSVYTEEAVQGILAASFQDPQQQQQQQPTMMEPPPQPHLYPHQQQQQHMPPQQQQLVPPQAPGAAAPWQGQPFAPPPGAVPPYGYNPGMAAPAPWAPAAPHQMPQQQHPMGDPMAQGGGPQVPWAQPPAGPAAAGGGAPHQPGPPMLHHPPAMHHHLPPVPMAPDPHGGAPPPWQQQQQQPPQHPAAMMPPPAGPGFPPHQAPAPGLAPPAPSPAAAAAPWNAAPPLEHQFQPPPEEPQQPVNPMCFPPGILSSLLQKRDERPYEPLELDDIQREGLPDPNEPDAFLRSRIDKFYAEISGYYGTKTRSQVLSDRGQDPRGLLPSSRTDEPDHQASTARFHEIDPATGMRADGSFAKPKGDRTKGGLGSHKREAGDDADPDDVYGMYRKGRSGLYHSGSFASKARGRS